MDDKMNEFERHLKVYLWDEVENASGIREMHNTEKFKGKHSEAAGTYLIWLEKSYPKVKPENREAQRQQHLKNLYTIFRNHCPNHDIFRFVDEDEQ